MAKRQESLLTKKAPEKGKARETQTSGDSSALRAQGVKTGIGMIQEGVRDMTEFSGRIGISKEVRFKGEQERLKGALEAVSTLELFNDIQAANIVAAFSSGIRLQGSASTVQQAIATKANFSIAIAQANAKIKSLALKREADRIEAEARFKKKMAPFKIIVGGVIAYFSAGQA